MRNLLNRIRRSYAPLGFGFKALITVAYIGLLGIPSFPFLGWVAEGSNEYLAGFFAALYFVGFWAVFQYITTGFKDRSERTRFFELTGISPEQMHGLLTLLESSIKKHPKSHLHGFSRLGHIEKTKKEIEKISNL